MAKMGVFDSDPTLILKTTELKREFQRLVTAIIDDEEDDDYSVEAVDQAKEALCALERLKLRKRSLSWMKSGEALCCPDEFRCPLSKDLMRDPVVVASGQTFDRPFIQQWLKAGNRICPCTQQVLSHTILVPNHLIREMISQWCITRGIEMSEPVNYLTDEGVVTDSDRDHFICLLEKMSSTISDKKAAAKELRLLTKRMSSFRVLFGEYEDAILLLLAPLSEGRSQENCNAELQEDVIATLLNLSIHDNNKNIVAQTPTVFPLLIEALRTGTTEAGRNAAAALFTLSALDSNKLLIGKSGALKPLIELLEEGDSLSVKDASSAIFNVCILQENKARAVRDGAIRVILKKITDHEDVDELLAILAVLSTHPRAVEEMQDLGAVSCLLGTMRETACARNKENCVAILYAICFYDRTKWKEIRDDENTYGTISELTRNGTSRAMRKAAGILERLNRAVNITHTA